MQLPTREYAALTDGSLSSRASLLVVLVASALSRSRVNECHYQCHYPTCCHSSTRLPNRCMFARSTTGSFGRLKCSRTSMAVCISLHYSAGSRCVSPASGGALRTSTTSTATVVSAVMNIERTFKKALRTDWTVIRP